MTHPLRHGILIALTAGGLFAAACKKSDEAKGSSARGTTPPATKTADKTDKVHCGGVNECKGQGGCKSAANACKGQNGCKGQSFVDSTADECATKGGKVMPPM